MVDFPAFATATRRRAATSGLSVVELRPADRKASAEIESLFEHLLGAGRRSRALQQDRQTVIRLG